MAEKRKQEAERRFTWQAKTQRLLRWTADSLTSQRGESTPCKQKSIVTVCGVENLKMAEHHESKAAGLETYLDTVIFDDDPDAVEKMEAKISALESRQKMMAEENKVCRKQKIAAKFQAFELKNNNANLRRCKDRLATLKGVKSLKERAEKSASGVIIDQLYGGKKARIICRKADHEIISA